MAELLTSYSVDFVAGEEWQENIVRQENGIAALSKALKLASGGELAGEEIAWQRADGYARYLVAREEPLQLIHLAVGDAWSVEDALIRGLTLDDVRDLVERRRAISDLFADAKETHMDQQKALTLAKECLLIRADQWREMGEIGVVDLEEMYESSKDECHKMSEMYKKAYQGLDD